jgi:hypothetical protein
MAAAVAWVACFLLLVSSLNFSKAVQSACPVVYSDSSTSDNNQTSTPLLFGGYYNRCQSGCQPREDIW